MYAVLTKTLQFTNHLPTRARAKFTSTAGPSKPVTVTYAASHETVGEVHALAASRLILRQFPQDGDPRGVFANWVRGDTPDGYVFVYVKPEHPIRNNEGAE